MKQIWPLGSRGSRPFAANARIPGAHRGRATADVAHAMGQLVPLRNPLSAELPGLDRFKQHEFPLRPYQRECVSFLTHRAYAICALPMRAGKTLTTLAAATAVDARRVLVICPAKARLVWAREIAKWLEAPALLTYGRGANKVRWYQAKNYLTPSGTARVNAEEWDVTWQQSDLFAIVNFELTIPHRATREDGFRFEREDLPGWAPFLAQQKFDLVIIDESHEVRCWTRSRFKTTREAVAEICAPAEAVWALTGTPLVSSPRDYGSQLDIASGGLYWYQGKPFAWDIRYCGAGRGQYGWELRQPTHVEELSKRLEVLMFQRSRSEILPDMPPKIRQVIRLENDSPIPLAANGAPAAIASKAMAATIKHKLPVLVSNLEEDREGKAIVFCQRRKSAETVFKALQKKLKDRQLWLVLGGNENHRDNACAAFRDADSGAILVCTIDTMDGAISLRGATAEHWLEFHFNPTTMLQAEDRPYEPDITHGLAILYYILENSIDEYIEEKLLPKVDLLAQLSDKEQADQFVVLGKEDEPGGILEEVFAAMMGDE